MELFKTTYLIVKNLLIEYQIISQRCQELIFRVYHNDMKFLDDYTCKINANLKIYFFDFPSLCLQDLNYFNMKMYTKKIICKTISN
jgi:hypothetical protein